MVKMPRAALVFAAACLLILAIGSVFAWRFVSGRPSTQSAANTPLEEKGVDFSDHSGLPRKSTVKDAYNAIHPGMTEQDILQVIGTPESSGETDRPGIYAGSDSQIDQPNLPPGRVDNGQTKQMVYRYQDGALMIYLAGTNDGDHPQTGGDGSYFVCYKDWIIQ